MKNLINEGVRRTEFIKEKVGWVRYILLLTLACYGSFMLGFLLFGLLEPTYLTTFLFAVFSVLFFNALVLNVIYKFLGGGNE